MTTELFSSQEQKEFDQDDLSTWNTILTEHNLTRRDQIIDLFHEGLEILQIAPNKIPNLNEINKT